MRKPNNWYEMSYDEQRQWEKTQRDIEDAEWEARQAQERADEELRQARREAHRQQEESWEEYRNLSDEYNTVLRKNKTLRAALLDIQRYLKAGPIKIKSDREFCLEKIDTALKYDGGEE